jgi:hypothetical protein
MSIISSFQVDDSAALAKQFAAMTAGYIDNPPDPKVDPAALVPVENVYRLLEMFRYDAFGDESRDGVLAMDGPDQAYEMHFAAKPWHEAIVQALQNAVLQAYGVGGKDRAVEELQASLRDIVKKKDLDQAVASRAKKFLAAFEAQLA